MALARLVATSRRIPAWSIAGAIVFGVIFLALAALVEVGATRALDLTATITFQRIASTPLDLIANADTILGQLVVTLAGAILLAALVWRRMGLVAALALGLILVTGPIELLLKSTLHHPSPPIEFVRAFHNFLGIRIDTEASFPSGHVIRVTFLVLTAASLFPRVWTPAAATLFVVLTVFLRVYIGDHWISDAIAGAALGAAFASLAVGWMRATVRR